MLSGTVLSGQILLGHQLWLGPSESGTFSAVSVTGIQREQVCSQRLLIQIMRSTGECEVLLFKLWETVLRPLPQIKYCHVVQVLSTS